VNKRRTKKTLQKEQIMLKLKIAGIVKLAAILGLLGLGACSTMEGFGRDVESAGNAIEEAAQEE
jgi:predicted small secreted protein